MTRELLESLTIGEPLPDIDERPITLNRRRIDRMLVAAGAVVAIVLAVAGGLLTWGSSFADDYVGDELRAQNIFFPDADALREEGRDDLLGFAGEQVTTGDAAEAYASYIDGHLAGIADGQTTPTSDGLPGRGHARSPSRSSRAPPTTRSPPSRRRRTRSPASVTACSVARRSVACCCPPSPGRRSATSPSSPRSWRSSQRP